jgi:hypothetical protein
MRYLGVGERIILTLWVGGLWAVGFLAVPVLFHSLDKHAAGELAAPMFTLINGFGLVCGGLLLLFAALSQGSGWYRSWRTGVIAVMMAVAAIILFVIQPQMAVLKAQIAAAGGELGPQFGRLHGISSILYLIASVLGLLLVAAGGRHRGEM